MSDITAQRAPRKNDPEATRENILEVATEEFARDGLSGARVDAIAEATATSKRMIYYYFGSKEGLYLAVLERAYARIRSIEEALDLSSMAPTEALRALIGATFDYDEANPDFVRLVCIENVHKAEHLKRSDVLHTTNRVTLELIEAILTRGYADGTFRRRIEPLELHQMISALCFFRVANRHTFNAIFDRDMLSAPLRARHRVIVAEMVLSYLCGGDSPG